MAVWCPCIVFGKNKQRLDSLHYQGTPLQGSGETYTAGCYLYGLLCPCCQGWALQVCSDDDDDKFCNWILTLKVHRLIIAPPSGTDTGFVETILVISSLPGSVARARSRRNAGKSNWRRRVCPEDNRLLITLKHTLINFTVTDCTTCPISFTCSYGLMYMTGLLINLRKLDSSRGTTNGSSHWHVMSAKDNQWVVVKLLYSNGAS
jgi:hypothetical protein